MSHEEREMGIHPDQAHLAAQEPHTSAEPSGAWTPGPWHVEATDTLRQVRSADGIIVVSTSWHGSLRKPYPLKPEAEANARLIAAAPELYEACRYIVDAGETGDEMTAIEKARAALAKAEGRS